MADRRGWGWSERERTDGGGHSRLWWAPGRVIIAHRFAIAVRNALDVLAHAWLLGHGCHHPLCQQIARARCGLEARRRTGASWPSCGGRPTARWPTHADRVGGLGNCATSRVRTCS